MPIPRRRLDGFSDDGSYSVASDFDKQMGEAMAEYDARRKDPRFVPGARVESPDSPDLLQQELIDPILTSFGFNSGGARNFSGRQAAPKTYEIGNELIQYDPVAGQAKSIYKGEAKPVAEKPAPRYEVPTGFDILKRPTGAQKLTLDELELALPTLPDQVRTNAPVTTLMQLHEAQKRQRGGQPTSPVKPGQRGLLPKGLVQDYLSKAKGDRALAEKLAQDDGYETQY